MPASLLGIKTTFDSGIDMEIQKDANGALFMVLSGGGLQAPLSLPMSIGDAQKLIRLLAITQQLAPLV